MKWIKAKVTKEIEGSLVGCRLVEGTEVYVSKSENSDVVDVITVDGLYINTISVEKAKAHLKYITVNGKYIVHKDGKKLREKFVRVWNNIVH